MEHQAIILQGHSFASQNKAVSRLQSNNTIKCFFLLVSIFLVVSSASAQSIFPSTINITGQFGTSKDFQFEISIGESTSITTMANSNFVLTSGVLQTSVAFQPVLNPATPLSEEIRIYPNPARDFVSINFVSKLSGMIQYQLFDLQGRLLSNKQFFYYGNTKTDKLDVSGLMAGSYFIAIQQYSSITNELIKKGSFKITKVN